MLVLDIFHKLDKKLFELYLQYCKYRYIIELTNQGEEIKMKKSVIMSNAWKIARKGQNQFGGKVTDYLSEALKQAWEIARSFQPKQFDNSKKLNGMMTGKQDWFITKLMKELDQQGIDVIDQVPGVIEYLNQGTYGTSKQEASELIGELLNMKKAVA